MCDSQLEERYIVIKLSDMDEVVRDEIDIFMRVYGIKASRAMQGADKA